MIVENIPWFRRLSWWWRNLCRNLASSDVCVRCHGAFNHRARHWVKFCPHGHNDTCMSTTVLCQQCWVELGTPIKRWPHYYKAFSGRMARQTLTVAESDELLKDLRALHAVVMAGR